MESKIYFGKTKKTEEDYLKEYPVEIGLLVNGTTIRKTCELTGTSQQTVYKLKKMFAQGCGEKARNPKGNTKGNGAGREKKPIAQYTKDGKLVKVWESQYAVGVAFDCVGRSGWFGMCADGKMVSYKGYVWRHVTSKRVPKQIKVDIQKHQFLKARKVSQYTMSGKFVKTYDSISQACKENEGFNTGGISSCLRGISKQYGGYMWKDA